jgi:uncharacterized repeat protein (TIGR04076 family)
LRDPERRKAMSYCPVRIVVEKVDGTCPYYKEGDTFSVERSAFILDESTKETGLCLHASARMTPELAMMTRGLVEKERFVACGDLPRRIMGVGARVTFRLVPGKKKEALYATKEEWEKARREGRLEWKDKNF